MDDDQNTRIHGDPIDVRVSRRTLLRAAGIGGTSLLGIGGADRAAASFEYSALWREGGGAQWVHSGITFDELKDLDAKYIDQSLRLRCLERWWSEDGASERHQFHAVWREGSGEIRWHVGLSLDEFKDQDQIYFDAGLRIEAITDVQQGRFGAIWRPGSGEQRWHAGVSFDEFDGLANDYYERGLRIVAMRRQSWDPNTFMAVWRPGDGAQWAHLGLDYNGFAAQDTAYYNQGLRLVTLPSVSDGVWRPGGAQWVHWQQSWDTFTKNDDAYFAQGLRITDLIVGGW